MDDTGPLLWRRDGLEVSTDNARLDLVGIHRYLADESYWAWGIPFDVVRRALANSLNFGLYGRTKQLGFARVITDRATYAYLCDVHVAAERRGQGLGSWLIECVLAHPDLQGLRRFSLATRDAHALYRRAGFEGISRPESLMEIRRPNPYGAGPIPQDERSE